MTTSEQPFQDQHVVVTGGTRGIGRAVAEAFLARGATVHATYRGDDAAASALRESVGAAADRLHTSRGDVCDVKAVQACWEELALDVSYRDLKGRVTKREVWPLGIVHLKPPSRRSIRPLVTVKRFSKDSSCRSTSGSRAWARVCVAQRVRNRAERVLMIAHLESSASGGSSPACTVFPEPSQSRP